ncbi:hypothetical protein [Aliiroseovarius subalbicans]|uniref:hypothetical protein n=1 Tax=Aliiroseovarius subalbicans TaxID=2925840 RepID=UPI001F562833|nr:hypothetical protein [Aliiroseovarius subalbicans]MCI2398468.1 hypothetical protein [Aliiroseovarius subalbicans]
MIGIVLWYNPDKKVGLVWCEDQGPLAFIGPEIAAPDRAGLGCGDQITFASEMRDKVRYVVVIQMVQPGRTHADPKAVLAAYHGEVEARQLRVVA